MTFDDGEFIVTRVGGGAMEVIVDSKGAGERRCGCRTVSKMHIARDGFGGDTEIGMRPSCVGEGWEGVCGG